MGPRPYPTDWRPIEVKNIYVSCILPKTAYGLSVGIKLNSAYSLNQFIDDVKLRHKCLFLFDLIIYVPSTIFQLCRDGSSWVEPVLS